MENGIRPMMVKDTIRIMVQCNCTMKEMATGTSVIQLVDIVQKVRDMDTFLTTMVFQLLEELQVPKMETRMLNLVEATLKLLIN